MACNYGTANVLLQMTLGPISQAANSFTLLEYASSRYSQRYTLCRYITQHASAAAQRMPRGKMARHAVSAIIFRSNASEMMNADMLAT